MDARIAWPMRWGGVTAIIRAEGLIPRRLRRNKGY